MRPAAGSGPLVASAACGPGLSWRKWSFHLHS